MKGGNWRFVVYEATEGTEQVPQIRIVTRAVAAAIYGTTGGVPVAGQTYGNRWDHIVVGEVAGFYADFKQTLYAALEAGQRLQARLDDQLQKELTEAEDDEERQRIRDFYSMFREAHLEVELNKGQPAIESEVPVVKLAEDRHALIAYLSELQPAWGE